MIAGSTMGCLCVSKYYRASGKKYKPIMIKWIEKQFIQNKKVLANVGYENLTILLSKK